MREMGGSGLLLRGVRDGERGCASRVGHLQSVASGDKFDFLDQGKRR